MGIVVTPSYDPVTSKWPWPQARFAQLVLLADQYLHPTKPKEPRS